MSDDVAVIYDDSFLEHFPDGYDPERPDWTEIIKERLGEEDEGDMAFTHPERPERLQAILEALEEEPVEGLDWLTPEPAPREVIERVHTKEHIDNLESYRGKSGWLNIDTTAVSDGSIPAAERAVGASLKAVETVWNRTHRRSFALVRPPGHHAYGHEATGFCLYNNVAIAARYALDDLGAERVLIVDYDAHHGNGTQAIVNSDPRIMHFDVHAAAPVYPGTGPLTDTGRAGAAGTVVNVPLPLESGSSVWLEALEAILRPAARRFRPDIIIVSAGFDAHPEDLLMNVDENGYAAMTGELCDLADELCEGRIAFVLEGGYREALSLCVRTVLRVLTTGEVPKIERDPDDPGREALQLAVTFHNRPLHRRRPPEDGSGAAGAG